VAVLGGVRLALARRERAAGAVMVLAAALKASAGVVLPYAAIGVERRGRALVGAAVAAAGAAVVSVAVFGDEVTAFIKANQDQQNLVAVSSVPNQAGVLLGEGGITPAIRAVAYVTLAAVLVWTLVRTWRGADWIASAGWATLAVIVCSAWIMPWYAVWVLPLAAIGRDRRLVAATLLLCAYLVYVRTPF
jgi:alpha-1,6-mannosyltransferase